MDKKLEQSGNKNSSSDDNHEQEVAVGMVNPTEMEAVAQFIPNEKAATESVKENESVAYFEHTYVEPDGTRVIKKTTIRRIKPLNQTTTPSKPGEKKVIVLDSIDPSTLTTFEASFLGRHNELRALHGSPPLQMSRTLCQYAQEWADHLAHHNIHVHRPSPKKFGENIFWKSSPSMKLTGYEGVNSWYEEYDLYDKSWYGGDPPRNSYKVSGHFTQLIWKSSTHLGVGVAINGNSFYVVANYHPLGNYFTRYKDNVLPLITSTEQSNMEQQVPVPES
ncbi:CRISP [Blomia tropicalis]|nr:CRISP [Blomia tropicalis]